MRVLDYCQISYPNCLPKGKSALDELDRKRLRQLWEENTRRYVGRGQEELIFSAFTGIGRSRHVSSSHAATLGPKRL